MLVSHQLQSWGGEGGVGPQPLSLEQKPVIWQNSCPKLHENEIELGVGGGGPNFRSQNAGSAIEKEIESTRAKSWQSQATLDSICEPI